MQISGIGPAKATTILAAIELGKRAFQSRPQTTQLTARCGGGAQSRFDVADSRAICRSAAGCENRLIGTQVITIGTATETLAPPVRFSER